MKKSSKSCWVWSGVKFLSYGVIGAALLTLANFLPTKNQHFVERGIAKAAYNNLEFIARVPDELKPYGSLVKYFDRDGGIIGSYGRKEKGEISEDAKKALLACEDHYFLFDTGNSWFENIFLVHDGVSLYNIAGAIFDRINGKNRGGSTIVMQDVKKMVNNLDRTYANKFEEIVLAYNYVEKFGKEKMLEHYMSNVPLGNRVSGFQAAATAYFAKPLDELNIQQIVTLGSIIPNHNRLRALYMINNGESLPSLSSEFRRAFCESREKINSALRHLHKIGEIDDIEFQNWLVENEEDVRKIGLKGPDVGFYGNDAWAAREITSEILSRDYPVKGKRVSGRDLLLNTPGESLIVKTEIDPFLVKIIKENAREFLESDYYDRILRFRNGQFDKTFGRQSWQEDMLSYEKRGIKHPYENDFESFMSYLKENINIGVMAVNQEGNIIAKVGGKEFFLGSKSQEPDFAVKNKKIIDILKSPVAVGSTIKPITAYAAMALSNMGVLDEEISLDTLFADIPLEEIYIEKLKRKVWKPGNWYNYNLPGTGKNRYWGRKYSLLEAQVLSVNTIFARLYSNPKIRKEVIRLFDVAGLEYDHEAAQWWPYGIGAFDVDPVTWLGIHSSFVRENPKLSIPKGAFDVDPVTWLNLSSAFDIRGNYQKPSMIKEIFLDGEKIYDKNSDFEYMPRSFFSNEKARTNELIALHEVCNRGSGRAMGDYFEKFKDRVTGKTGTETAQKTSLFVSHFNPYDRELHSEKTISMIVVVTTNSGGDKRVGYSTEGPVRVAGMIYNDLYERERRVVN